MGISHDVQMSILATVIILIVLFLLRRAAKRLVMNKVEDARLRYRWFKGG